MDDPRALAKTVCFTIGGYPLFLAKTLIQFGYEPVPPSPAGRLPNMIAYCGILRRERGFLSLYTGLGYHLTGVIIKQCTQKAIAQALNHKIDYKKDEPKKIVADCLRESVIRINVAIIVYPICTITIGHIAAIFFNSSEPIDYSLKALYKGFVPKIIFEVIAVCVEIVSRRITAAFIEEETPQALVSRVPPFLANSLFYPFNVVSTVMAENGRSGLNPKFDNWKDCWNYLSENNGLKRGSNIFWRGIQGGARISSPYMTSEYFRFSS